jgi:DUF1365 family protein
VSASCLYEGAIRHRRRNPPREFRHPLALAYIDLEELPGLLDGRLADRRPGPVKFRREDYLGDARIPLDEAVRSLVSQRLGAAPTGPIRLLTQLRSFGHCFNPVSFYYCFEPGGRIGAVVAEVTNTPWGERHAYVVQGASGSFDKALHVSPFMGMDHTYECRLAAPGRTLAVHIESRRCEERAFDATLSLRRRELTPASLRRVTARYPLATMRVLALIYMHALGLRLAGARVFPHPGRPTG